MRKTGSDFVFQGIHARLAIEHRGRFAHVSMLTGAPFVQLTAKFVQRFAGLGEVMRIYTDEAAFDAALAATTQMRKIGSVPI